MMPAGGVPAMMPAGGVPAMMPAGGVPAMMPAGGAVATTRTGRTAATTPAGGEVATTPAGGEVATTRAGGEVATMRTGRTVATTRTHDIMRGIMNKHSAWANQVTEGTDLKVKVEMLESLLEMYSDTLPDEEKEINDYLSNISLIVNSTSNDKLASDLLFNMYLTFVNAIVKRGYTHDPDNIDDTLKHFRREFNEEDQLKILVESANMLMRMSRLPQS